ncbi:unnamed protein product [Euphydryas editha]|uniref:Ig-like domain-containing protein n=1 Tax=Euphydryas editha TaxID=104508 RepID=A0AAU9USZ4_EUPED|nr:unnamed protein product [Euphydryas editha]
MARFWNKHLTTAEFRREVAKRGVLCKYAGCRNTLSHIHPLVQVPNQLVGAPTGTDVTLQCHVEASPKAINYWTRENGEMIISNDKYHMSEINSSAYSVQMRLVIRNIQGTDLGGYKCISKNSIGDAEGNIRLYEMELPYRKNRPDDDHDSNMEETNDVRSSLQNSLREGGRTEDAGFLGGGGPPAAAATRATPYAIFLISALVYATG